MNEINKSLRALFDRIPRRHTADNVKEMYSILDAYEELLKTMEADDRYEKQIAHFFEVLDPIRTTIKKSTDHKASKKGKDMLFDEASGSLKDTMEELMQLNVSSGD
jgi:chloramphenicol O-acetyltransferase